jgi:hypothetical protein
LSRGFADFLLDIFFFHVSTVIHTGFVISRESFFECEEVGSIPENFGFFKSLIVATF